MSTYDPYKLLSYLKDNTTSNGVPILKIKEDLKLNDDEIKQIIIEGYEHGENIFILGPTNDSGSIGIRMNALSLLLDKKELDETRQSSRDAMKIATKSLWIAICVGGLQIVMSLIQLCNPL